MISAIEASENSNDNYLNRVDLKDLGNFHDKQMNSFVSAQSLNFFKRFNIRQEFLKIDPSLWSEDPHYLSGLKIVKNLKVVNDTAERAVHLMEGYNNRLTRNEDQKQYILQVTSEYRRRISDSRKQTVMQDF